MKYVLLTMIFVIFVSMTLTANGILIGDGKKDSDVILVGKVISYAENEDELETTYTVNVEEYLKTSKNYDTNKKTVTIISPGLRQYKDPTKEVIASYEKIFNVGDRVLFLLYLNDGKLRESLYSLTTKSSCSPKQLLDEMYGPSGLSISQNNQSKHLYTNKPVDLTFYVYNRDLISEKKDFEFAVFTPNGKISEKRQVQLQECKRSAGVSWSFIPTTPGKYTFSAIIGDSEGGNESISGVLIEDYVTPPLKQFKSGIAAKDVICKQGLHLIKSVKNMPACVTPQTKQKLIQRGWDTYQSQSQNSVEVTLKDGTKSFVTYDISNGLVKNVRPSITDSSLVVEIESYGDGVLDIMIPRGLVDAKLGEEESAQGENFIVLINGREVDFKENPPNDVSRSISIPFSRSANVIEIIGTFLIPCCG